MRGMKWKAIVAGMLAGAALLMAGCGGSSSGDAAKSAMAAPIGSFSAGSRDVFIDGFLVVTAGKDREFTEKEYLCPRKI